MEDKQLTPQESMQLITEMISRTRDRYIGDGNIMLMWGYLTVGVSALVWILLALTNNPAWNYMWFIIWVVGGTLTPVMARRQYAGRGVKNYSDGITSQIWSAVGIAGIVMTGICIGFQLIGGVCCWKAMFVYALVIVPFAEIAQGIILREPSLTGGGVWGMLAGIVVLCCISGAIVLRADWFMPLYMAAFAGMMIVPGHILNHKCRRAR